ncbi:VirD4-like conjugal transfer protein, CD1115 family [Spiroplasma platyhelix]|uniref:Type IV secretory system conjugative DNA transfer family protein n=1 Tax=Spiroplasma platyhelix PALS-1 TaxID=1276218 RepID=A0A846TXJ6_9MOLU|nr:type IV secretory system conjugative DNA transfer family protein [Spiroplasma platyhelix]MBE4704432.1 hypothetical protein [Spiroplasma platyhelix PALS-1]NKE38801.1 type IV secretory system conjugative DNA transfer family protein [Spiroplasma platyhelix PALS-1]UJB29014.1 type IV secretion system protein VirD4 [Spiroplasma platyhelix PALS-1]
MKKIVEYKWHLVIGLLILPIIFIFLITVIGMIIDLIEYSNIDFNLFNYWSKSFSNWYYSLLSFLLSFIIYFYYGYKVCFATKKEATLKATKKNDYGNARWLNKKEINQLYPLVYGNRNHKQHGFVVNSKKEKNTLFHNIRTNTHSLVIGGTGSGKTQGLVLPTINCNAKSEIKPSMVITDVKGELYKCQARRLQKQGYSVKVLNLRNIRESITWNPLQAIYDQFKTMLLSHRKQTKLHLKVQIQSDIQDLTKTLFASKNQIDSFWNESGALITEAIILGILEKTEALINKNESQENKTISKLLNKYLPVNQFNLASVTVIASLDKDMVSWFKSFPDTSIAKITANQVLQNGSKTLTSIIMTMSTNLSIFKNEFIRNLTCQNDLNFNNFIKKPTALFVIIPDENKNYYIFVTLLIMQLYKFLVTQANKKQTGKLERPVYFLCDEFGNLPTIPNMESIITIARGRNIFFQLIIQDLQQLKEKYGSEVANIIFTNCSLHIFLQTMALETAEKYSKMIGYSTVIQIGISGKGEVKRQSENLAGRPLILASDLMRLSSNQAIIFYAKENAFKATLIPWYQISSNHDQLEIYKKRLKLINFEKDYYYNIKNEKNSLIFI